MIFSGLYWRPPVSGNYHVFVMVMREACDPAAAGVLEMQV